MITTRPLASEDTGMKPVLQNYIAPAVCRATIVSSYNRGPFIAFFETTRYGNMRLGYALVDASISSSGTKDEKIDVCTDHMDSPIFIRAGDK